MDRKIEYIIKEVDADKSIEKFLLDKGYSRANIIDLKKMKESIILDGTWVRVKDVLKAEQVLKINFIEEKISENILPVKLEFSICYEDEDIIVINKPASMPIHPSLNNYSNSLANALAYYYREKQQNFVFRVINRLDKDTTGLVIVAKNSISASILYKAMKNREIKRKYKAIVEDDLNNLKDSDIINLKIGRENSSLIRRCVDEKNGENAVTKYKKLRHKGAYTLIELELETGRTHQIRVHMSYIGNALVGDYMYNKNFSELFKRPLLHSYSLEFKHPITEKKLKFILDLPNDMKFMEE